MTIPWLLNGTPYKVQTKALNEADSQRGYAYFMEMGLGKTATCLNEFVNLKGQGLVDKMVVVCPQSLKRVWVDEAEEWGAVVPDVDPPFQIWPKIPKDPSMFNYLAINYEAMIGRGGEYIEEYLENNRTYLVLDESIHVKNPQAKRTKRLVGLCALAKFVRVLSGAPMTKSPLDLWGQLRCIGALNGWNPYAFRNHFCVMGGYLGKQVVGARNQDELTKLIHYHGFRALKKDWTDLPEQLNSVRNYEMRGEQLRQYKDMMVDFVLRLETETITAPMIITQAMKLQQISSGFIFDEEGELHELVQIKDNPKIIATLSVVDGMDTKIIIFAFYKPSIKNLRVMFPDAAYIVGGQDLDEQMEEKRRFNNDDDCRIIICQLTAGKYGHTLLGQQLSGSPMLPCHTNLYYENNYDLDARIQSESRAHRHGQNWPVTSIDLIGSPQDKKIIQALVRKLNMAQSIVDAVRA
jgi:SNF2 family DNA or RNA helicase